MRQKQSLLLVTACFLMVGCGDSNSFSTAEKVVNEETVNDSNTVSKVDTSLETEVFPAEDAAPPPREFPVQEVVSEKQVKQQEVSTVAKVSKEEPVVEEEVVEKPVQVETVMSEAFHTTTVQTPIDVVWAIDNSWSMTEEVENVRKNFSFFMDAVKEQLDVKVALLSSDCRHSNLYLRRCLDLTREEQSRVNLWVQDPHEEDGASLGVGSTNALALLASASCEASLSNGKQYKICGIDVEEQAQLHASKRSYIGFQSDVFGVAGELVGFFRKEAKKVFIVVTDDSPGGFYASSYLKTMDSLFGQGNHFFYSFSMIPGEAVSETCKAGTGGVEIGAYQYLSRKTFGENYHICEESWEQHFQKLTQSIKSVATREFTTQHTCQEVVGVSVDETELSPEQFTFTFPSRLSIAEGVLELKEQQIVLRCKV